MAIMVWLCVKIDGVIAYGKDTRQNVGYHDYGRFQALAELQIKSSRRRALIGSRPAEGSSKKNVRVKRHGRARPARFYAYRRLSRRIKISNP
jgi:hypothetical protein